MHPPEELRREYIAAYRACQGPNARRRARNWAVLSATVEEQTQPEANASERSRSVSPLTLGLAVPALLLLAVLLWPDDMLARMGELRQTLRSTAAFQNKQAIHSERTRQSKRAHTMASPSAEPAPLSQASAMPQGHAPNKVTQAAGVRPASGKSEQSPPQTKKTTSIKDPVAAEVALMKRVRRALDLGHDRQALALMRRHASRFPEGLLIETRLAWSAAARCRLGQRRRGRRDLRALQESYPASLLLKPTRAACGEGK